MLNIPDLNRMKIFHSVYAMRNLAKAADALHITRSAVSQSLKLLEDELQSKLFIRNSKMVIPTEPAHLLFRSIDPFLSDMQQIVQQIENGKAHPIGHLRIGAPQDFGSTHLTESIVQFRKLNPQVTFELILATPMRLLEQLCSGVIDLAFVDNGDFHAKNFPVSLSVVMKEELVLTCSKKYFDLYVRKLPAHFSDLKNLDFIDYFQHGPVVKMWIKHHFKKNISNLRVVFSAESVRALIKATQGGLGLSVLPKHMIQEELKSGHLKMISVSERELINQITLIRHIEKPLTAKEKSFIEFYKYRKSHSN